MTMKIKIKNLTIGGNLPIIIAGPCVIENEDITVYIAKQLKNICQQIGLPLIFKGSFNKANRTSITSFRGVGINKGLQILEDIKNNLNIPILSDVHTIEDIKTASQVLDVLQIPAFLCRQTDLVLTASNTGKTVNIKKGQFLAPWDVKNIIEKFISTGNKKLFITERGTSFGYNNLIVDFRAFPIMRSFGYPIIFDVTHSVQLPGGQGKTSGGQREFVIPLARAAIATGIDGLFIEVHPDPDKSPCDGQNMIPLKMLKILLKEVKAICDALKRVSCNLVNKKY